jgi:hypothetical protein
MSSPPTLPSDHVHTSSPCPLCIYAQPVVALPGIVTPPAMKVRYSRRPIPSQFTPSCRQLSQSSPVIAITSLHTCSRPTVTPRLSRLSPTRVDSVRSRVPKLDVHHCLPVASVRLSRYKQYTGAAGGELTIRTIALVAQHSIATCIPCTAGDRASSNKHPARAAKHQSGRPPGTSSFSSLLHIETQPPTNHERASQHSIAQLTAS